MCVRPDLETSRVDPGMRRPDSGVGRPEAVLTDRQTRTRCLFPLRTSVEWFKDSLSPAIGGRVKQAVVLYDDVLFEDGAFEADLTDGGAFQVWHPADAVTEERLAELRRPPPPGIEVSVSFGKEEEYGVPAPADAMRTIVHGKIVARYIAEFNYSVLAELAEFNTGWAQLTGTGGASRAHGAELGRLMLRDRFDEQLLGDRPNERHFVIDAFYRDLALSSQLGATISMSPLFEPMLERAPVARDDRSARALEVVFPYVGELPWEAVMAFREHNAVQEAR